VAVTQRRARTEPLDSVDLILREWSVVRPDLDASPVAVVTRLERVRAHLERELEAVFAEHGLSGPGFSVLVNLRRAGAPYELHQRELQARLGLTSGTVSVRVDRLVAMGVVERRPDPADGRGAVVALTRCGLELFEAVAPAHLANEHRLLSALTCDERDQLAGLLRKLLASFEGGAGGDPRTAQRLGLMVAPAHVALAMRRAVGLPDRTGLLVRSVLPGGSAAASGIRQGDLLVAVDGVPLRSFIDLNAAVSAPSGRPTLRLCVVRGVEEREAVVALDLSGGAAPAARRRTDRRRRSP